MKKAMAIIIEIYIISSENPFMNTGGPANSRTRSLAVYFYLATRDLGLLHRTEKH